MADGTIGEGAITVHPGAAIVAGTGGEVPVRHAERGRDPAEDTCCKRRLQAHGFRRVGEQSIWVEERKVELRDFWLQQHALVCSCSESDH